MTDADETGLRSAQPRVAVVGAGAMGSIFGAAFADAGASVELVDVSAPLVEKLRNQGLVIVGEEGERQVAVSATTDPGSLGTVDLVVFLVKCFHTEGAAEMVRPIVGERTIVASLQNGLGNGEILTRFFPKERIVVGVTYDSGSVLELGKVAHTYKAETFLGPYTGTTLDAPSWIADLLTAAGFHAVATDAIHYAIWEKLIMTAATLPTSALTGLTAGGLGEEQAMQSLIDGLVAETVETASAAGHRFDVAEQRGRVRRALVGEGKTSMLQDVEAGRRTEIDVINGAVVREAEARGVDVPLNRAMVALIKGYERAQGVI